MKMGFVATLLVVAAAVSGCKNAGGELAQASRAYAQCQLAEGKGCTLAAPPGTTAETTGLTTPGDAVRVSGEVARVEDCLSFAANARPERAAYLVQAVINGTVVTPYGEMKPVPSAVDSACAQAPYRVSLTLAKAP